MLRSFRFVTIFDSLFYLCHCTSIHWAYCTDSPVYVTDPRNLPSFYLNNTPMDSIASPVHSVWKRSGNASNKHGLPSHAPLENSPYFGTKKTIRVNAISGYSIFCEPLFLLCICNSNSFASTLQLCVCVCVRVTSPPRRSVQICTAAARIAFAGKNPCCFALEKKRLCSRSALWFLSPCCVYLYFRTRWNGGFLHAESPHFRCSFCPTTAIVLKT